MKILKILGVLVLLLIVLASITLYLLPGKAHVERSITIDASPTKVSGVLLDLKQNNAWSPWYEKDPEATYTYEGIYGVGSRMAWKGNSEVGEGALWIDNVSDTLIEMGMDFGMGGSPGASYILKPVENGTMVTWTFDQKMKGVDKLFGLMMDSFLGPDYEKGLQKLKKYIEEMPDVPAAVSKEHLQPQLYIGSRSIMPEDPAMISVKMGQMFGAIMTYLQTDNIEMMGPPFTIYEGVGTQRIEMIAGIPVKDTIAVDEENLFIGNTPQGLMLKVVHSGSYHKLPETHEAIQAYLDYTNMQVGPPMEQYITDPGLEPDTAKWETHIFYPILLMNTKD